MQSGQLTSFQETITIISGVFLLISTISAVTFHVMGWHKRMDMILWGREGVNLGLMGNSMKMADWACYCIFPFTARRAQVDKQMANVPLKLKIFIHCHMWFGLASFALFLIFIPPSYWWNGDV